LRRVPATVSFLNPQPALSLAHANRPSCPNPDLETGIAVGSSRPNPVLRQPSLDTTFQPKDDPPLLGMSKVVSEDALRRALAKIE